MKNILPSTMSYARLIRRQLHVTSVQRNLSPAKSFIVLGSKNNAKSKTKFTRYRNPKPSNSDLDLEESTSSIYNDYVLERMNRIKKQNIEELTSEAFSDLEAMKPSGTVSLREYSKLSEQIMNGFTKQYMYQYLAMFKGMKQIRKSAVKKYYVKLILDKVWKVTPRSDLETVPGELSVAKVFDIDAKLKFFLHSKNDELLLMLTSNNVTIDVMGPSKIIVRGPSKNVDWFETTMSRFLSSLKKEVVDFGPLVQHFKMSADRFQDLLPSLMKKTGIFFQRFSGLTYTLIAPKSIPFSVAKRIVLRYVFESSKMSHKDLILSLKDAKLARYANNQTLPSVHLLDSWCRIRGKSANTNEIKNSNIQSKEIQLGQVLFSDSTFQDSKLGNIGQLAQKSDKFIFHSDLPNVKKIVYDLPMINQEEFVTINLIPNLYKRETDDEKKINTDVNLSMQPPLSVWIKLDKNKEPIWDSLQVMKINSESYKYVLLPQECCDMKFVNVEWENLDVTQLLRGHEDVVDSKTDETNSKSIPSLYDFLFKSDLCFDGSKPLKIKPLVDIELNNERHLYAHSHTEFRNHITVKYKDDNTLLQFATVEGGALGGSRTELLLFKDIEEWTNEDYESLQFAAHDIVKTLGKR